MALAKLATMRARQLIKAFPCDRESAFKLAKLEFNDDIAKKAVLHLSIFPRAYFFPPYTRKGSSSP
jgi:hypothetical protein